MTGSVDGISVAVGNSNRLPYRQFRAGELLFAKYSRVKTSRVVKGENIERDPNYPDRLSANKLDDGIGDSCSAPSELREAVPRRISEG